MPHGGYGPSGFGRDMSQDSLDECTQVKHAMYDRTGMAQKPWHRTISLFPDRESVRLPRT